MSVARTVSVDGCDPIRLTDSMARGLLVVYRHDGRTRRSNLTTDLAGTRPKRPGVNWQAADQLLAAGLIEWSTWMPGKQLLGLTPYGRRVAYVLEDERGRRDA